MTFWSFHRSKIQNQAALNDGRKMIAVTGLPGIQCHMVVPFGARIVTQ
jgi:hypothetical protein